MAKNYWLSISFSYEKNAKKLAAMLNDKPCNTAHAILSHRLKLAVGDREIFALKASQKLNFMQFYMLDFIGIFIVIVVGFVSLLQR